MPRLNKCMLLIAYFLAPTCLPLVHFLQDPYPEYRLCGTIVHSGFSPDSGHYYAYIKNAMGRWYCCNDSYVSLSNLKEVMSEKVYILFFTRSKQRQSHVKTGLLSNGSKCHQLNGNGASQILKTGHTEKAMDAPPLSKHDSGMNGLLTSKADKVPSGPSRNLGAFENFGTRKQPANGSIKIVIHKKEPSEKTANGTVPCDAEMNQQKVQTSPRTNGISEVRPAFNVDPEKNEVVRLANGNGKLQRVKANSEQNGLSNGATKCNSDVSGLKRKPQDKDNCILLAKDSQSRAQVEDFKKLIGREASLLLRSCGWPDDVYDFMRSRKKLCVEESRCDTSNIHNLKRLLIADAKQTFNSKIPESLKGSLVERLILFSQQKQ